MVLVNNNNNIYSIIFVPMKDKVKEIWDGYRAGPEGAVKDYLFDQAFNNSDLDKEVPEILKGKQKLFYSLEKIRILIKKLLNGPILQIQQKGTAKLSIW